MVSRKLERLISLESGYIIYQSSLYRFFQLVYFFVLSESVSYLIFRDKIKDYTSDVLVRSESLPGSD